jgi:hypothetical protein
MLIPYSKVVGVTFDGRQNTLRKLIKDATWRSVSLIHTTYHNEETGEDEPAIQVKDYETKEVIGWIAKTDIDKYQGIYAMTAELGEYKGTMYANLYIPKTPSRNQYWMVKRACEKKGIKMPLYDVNAYESTFSLLRSTK